MVLSREKVFEIICEMITQGQTLTIQAIAARVGCDSRTVDRAIKDLKRAGRIVISPNYGRPGRGRQPSSYEVIKDDSQLP